jgi:hypothetical protein
MKEAILQNIKAQNERLHRDIMRQLDRALLDVFKYWAGRFPKRHLEYVSGMGTFTFISEGVDFFTLLSNDREKNMFWRPKHDKLLEPLLEFSNLYGCIETELGTNPLTSNFLYNPITRTIEYNQEIIYL